MNTYLTQSYHKGERIGAKGEDTKARLENAALSLFARQGYDKTTIKEITYEAGVSVALLYRYYSGKQDLLKQILDHILCFPQISDQYSDKSIDELLLIVARDLYKFTCDHKMTIQFLSSERHFNREVAQVVEAFSKSARSSLRIFLQRRIETGELREHNIDASIFMLTQSIASINEHMNLIPDIDAFLIEMVDIICRGIRK
jgi:AcrR family transcriptional regulator